MKYYIIGGILLVAIGFGLGKYFTPVRVVTKTETVIKTNDVIKEHTHTVVVTKELPNGEKDTITTIDDHTTDDKTSSSDNKTSTVTTYSKPSYKLQGLAGINFNNISTPVYGLGVERHIIGPIFAGAYGKTSGEIGLSISLEL